MNSISGSKQNGCGAMVIVIAISGNLICVYSLSCFGMRYSINEIAIQWRGAVCEFTLMFYEG